MEMPRDAFEGYDEPVNIDMDPEEALRILLNTEVKDDEATKNDPPNEEIALEGFSPERTSFLRKFSLSPDRRIL